MRKLTLIFILILLLGMFPGCGKSDTCQVVATTAPIYEFTSLLCQDTGITVSLLISESISCLHDYTLQVSQMRMLENAELLIKNGAHLEAFLSGIQPSCPVVDCAQDIPLLECSHEEEHHDHEHEEDPHFWLSPEHAKLMVQSICGGLSAAYPQQADAFSKNLQTLLEKLDALKAYGDSTLSSLSCRELITFHDGFSYFAESFDLTILKAIEEESGSEASAAELKEMVKLIEEHDLPAIFIETNGSTAAAEILAAETGVPIYGLDMGMSGRSYFDTMYQNIHMVKEALE